MNFDGDAAEDLLLVWPTPQSPQPAHAWVLSGQAIVDGTLASPLTAINITANSLARVLADATDVQNLPEDALALTQLLIIDGANDEIIGLKVFGIANQLDLGNITQSLRDEFTAAGVTLSFDATSVKVLEPGLRWRISDGEEERYIVEKEEDADVLRESSTGRGRSSRRPACRSRRMSWATSTATVSTTSCLPIRSWPTWMAPRGRSCPMAAFMPCSAGSSRRPPHSFSPTPTTRFPPRCVWTGSIRILALARAWRSSAT